MALALAGLCLVLCAWAADLQPIPPFGARVTDLTGTLDAQQKQTLSDELEALEKRKGSRMAVLIVPSTAPESIEQYSIRVTDSWLLARTDKHTQDGVLFTVAKDDHHVRIEVGRDLEGAITDVAASRIIREYVAPKFRANDYYGGIHDALDALIKLIDGEQLPAPLSDDRAQQKAPGFFDVLFIALLVTVGMRGALHGIPSLPRALLTGAIGAGIVWFLTSIVVAAAGMGVLGFLLGLFGGGGGGFASGGGFGGWGGGGLGGGGWSSGGGSFGGSSDSGGGGFSGGSGGGFAGGGASGSW